MKPLIVHLPAPTHATLKERSARLDVSMAEQIRRAVDAYLSAEPASTAA